MTTARCVVSVCRNARYPALLAGVSALALCVASPVAVARSPGGYTPASSQPAVAAAQSGAQEAARAAQQAQNALQRATRAIQAMQATQQAARDAAGAAPGNVPNGLQSGGLQVAPGAVPGSQLWQGARLPVETAANGRRTQVTVEQTQKQAILTWQSFNVGKETDLYFDQRAGGVVSNEWIVLNRVVDPSLAPSRILGSIKAEGQVYVVNKNGVIFGGTSQINVGTLLASSLNITDDQFRLGILYRPEGAQLPPAFVGTPGATRAVTVEAGAEIVARSGGKVLLFGGNVTNAGSITTPQGQTILAAGDAIWLEQNTAPESGGVRGIVANVDNGIGAGFVPSALPIRLNPGSGGTATNTGMITVTQGDITLVGQHVMQAGVLTATSSATLNGSIKLWARSDEAAAPIGGGTYFRGIWGGNLTLAEGSLTQVAVDDAAGDTLIDPTLFKASAIDVVGRTIVFQREASIIAPGGVVNIRAANFALPFTTQNQYWTAPGGSGNRDYLDDGSRVYLDAGSLIDVSGLQGVLVPMERNTVKAELRGDEFADFPQLRNGPLRGKTIYADRRVTGTREDGSIWIGTPYGNINGWADLVPYKADELSTRAGSVRIESRGDVIARANSTIAASGGSVVYQDGIVMSSKVIWQGRLYDISQLSPEMMGASLFDGFIRTHERWGVTEAWSSVLSKSAAGRFERFERGYAEGRSGGSILTTAFHAVLDGDASVGAGPTDQPRGRASVPLGGNLTFGDLFGDTLFGIRPAPNVVIGAPPSALASDFSATSALPPNLASTLYISPALLNESGAKGVTVVTAKEFRVAAGSDVTLAPGGSLTVVAASGTKIDGSIRVVSGDVTIQTGSITVGTSGTIDVSGLWVNLAATPSGTAVIYDRSWLDGGTVTLEAATAYGPGALTVSAGSLIDVSSGGLLQANGRLATGSKGLPLGNGGSISLISNAPLSANLFDGGAVGSAPTVIAGELRGYGFGTGGSLALSSRTIQIGGDPALTNSELYLTPEFFQSRGFANYRLIGWRGVMLASGTVLEPRVQNFVAGTGLISLATGSRLSNVAGVGTLSDYLRAPTHIALYAPDFASDGNNVNPAAQTYVPGQWGVAGDIILGAGSVIRTDPGATIDIRAARQLSVLGELIAPGGKITLGNELESGIAVNFGSSSGAGVFTRRNNVSLWVDSNARLSTSGVMQSYRDPGTGLQQAKIYDGGSISLIGYNVIVQPGSVLGVSGASGTEQVIARDNFNRTVTDRPIASNAGQLSVTAGNYLYFDPVIHAQPGDPAMRGAAFTLSTFDTAYNLALPLGLNRTVVWSGGTAPAPNTFYAKTIRLRDGSGRASDVARIGNVVPAQNAFSVFTDGLSAAMFDDIIFGRNAGLAFQSDTTLSAGRSIQLRVRAIGATGDVDVMVNAPYVTFGMYSGWGAYSTTGRGSFTVNADMIDFIDETAFSGWETSTGSIGEGFKTVTFNSSGDIRFFNLNNSPTSAGSLNISDVAVFNAAQLYPVTGGNFIINVDPWNPNARITVLSNGKPAAVPLSAGGRLTLQSAHIEQGGVVRAPAGQITLTNATGPLSDATITLLPGSMTSVDLDGTLIPFGQTRNDLDWIYPGFTQILPKLITFSGPTVDVRAGALVTSSGGGDLATYEFVPGPGGSKDVLAGTNVFAVVRGYKGPLPYDQSWGQGTSLGIGSSVYLAGIPGLEAGTYTLLPGHYALLPGGFRVTLQKADNDVVARPSYRTAMGAYLTSGYLTDQLSGARSSSDWSTFLVTPNSVVRTQTEYKAYNLSDFLTRVALSNDQVPVRLPNEPGRIQINATSLLTLEGVLRTAPVEGGRGGQIDIATGGNILITGNQSTPVAGTLVLRADQLSQLETESLLIGGVRAPTSADGLNTVLKGSSVTVNATNITVDTDGETLSGTEIIFAAKTGIAVRNGSIIKTFGTYRSAASPDLLLDQGTTASPSAAQRANNGSAVLSLSNGAKANFQRGNSRTGAMAAIGNIVIEDGVILQSGNSVLIDGANVNLAFGPTSELAGKSVQIGSNHISLGDIASATVPPRPGLVLDLGAIADLSRIADLTLRSRESIDLYGSFTLGRGAPGTQVVFDAAGLVGTAASGNVATVNAGTVRFLNAANVAATPAQLPPAGSGEFVVNAESIDLGGTFFVAGFSDAQLLATGNVTAVALTAAPAVITGANPPTGLFDVRNGVLTLQAARITAKPQVSHLIRAAGAIHVLSSPNPTGTAVSNAGGARLQLVGQSITHDGNIELPGGVVVLQASGDVAFGAHSITNASGFTKDFFDVSRFSPAGRVDVIAGGNVTVAAGAVINLSSPGDAGTFTVSAANGVFDLRGTLKGQGGAGYNNAGFSLDVGTVTDFDRINAILNAADFDRDRSFRVRGGDVVIGAAIRSHSFSLSADAGSITVASPIDASGALAGDIRLSAAGNVVLASGAMLDARGGVLNAAGHGGAIALESASGVIDMQAGSRIELATQGDTGELTLRVARVGNDIAAGTHLRGVLNGVGAINVEAVKVYDGITSLAASGNGAGILTFGQIHADNTAFINAAGAAVRGRLAAEIAVANTGFNAGRLHLLAGAEVRSSGDLTVTNNNGSVEGVINLADYRYGGEAGVLTLRAAGNLSINGNLSDGFTTARADTGRLLTVDAPNGLNAWSYRLIGGADLGSADVRSATGAGDVVVAIGKLVRTGTGDIEVHAGRDVRFAGRDSVLYTAGVGRDLTGLNVPLDVSFPGQKVAYGINGGDVIVTAGGNVSNGKTVLLNGGTSAAEAPSEELITAWLYRQGDKDSLGNLIPGRATSWWIDYTQYQQGGVGALGGGNVTVIAGDPRNEASGNINNLSVMLPTTGLYQNGREIFTNGGGTMTVNATGNINSGIFYVGRGAGELHASRSFAAGRTANDTNASANAWPVLPILALGDATLNLVAGGDAILETIFNPTVAIQVARNADGSSNSRSAFFTYTDRSAVEVTAVGGNAYINGDTVALWQSVGWNPARQSPQATGAIANRNYVGSSLPPFDDTAISSDYLTPYQIAPSILTIATLNGDVGFNGAFTLFSSETGTLDLLSAGSIRRMQSFNNRSLTPRGIGISDADPLRLPRPEAPVASFVDAKLRLSDDPAKPFDQEDAASRERLHAISPLHRGDDDPVRIYAAGGDIVFKYSLTGTAIDPIQITSAKPVWLWAARDIRDVQLLAQNVDPADLTLVRAGRDVRFSRPASAPSAQIVVAGPGRLEVEAGRHIDLGNSRQGVQSIGNLRNPNLAQTGASILLSAGMTDVHYADFAQAYLDPSAFGGVYDKMLIDYMHARLPNAGDLSPQRAWALFQLLAVEGRAPLIRMVLYAEVRAASEEAAKSGGTNIERYARGFKAIHTLFPESATRVGDITMFSSQVLTRDGGDVELLAPGGSLILGLTQAVGTLVTQGLGVQAQRTGNVYSMSYGDLVVNQAAVQTLEGGDIVMWSTTGNIDAGRGAKTRRQIATPRFRTDSYGTLLRDPGSTSTGAGIAVLQAIAGAPPGNIVLATPNGWVDAGDAGIRASGNVAIAALLGVRNADNIVAGGTMVGVPTVQAPNIGGLTEASNMAGAAAQQAAAPPPSSGPAPASIIIVEVIGYGGGDGEEPSDQGERPRQGSTSEQRSQNFGGQNPNSAYQVLGAGEMTADEARRLISERRQQLGR